MNKVKHSFFLFVILMIFWVLFTSVEKQELITGALVSLIITLISLKMEPILGDIKLTPKSILFSFIYLFVFIKELIISNIDVARRVIDPKLPIEPGIVKVQTKLKSKLGKMVLANSITLTPGTMTTEIKDDYLYIHWIEAKEKDVEGATKVIVQTFEKYLEVIFG